MPPLPSPRYILQNPGKTAVLLVLPLVAALLKYCCCSYRPSLQRVFFLLSLSLVLHTELGLLLLSAHLLYYVRVEIIHQNLFETLQ